ncbi:MAG: (Fe-S)-binding protein [Vicinamibacteria bacterium]|nr:(Fe-S)-binding protein [Vicinamibacteria bacterium]
MSLFDPINGQRFFAPDLPGYDKLLGCVRCGRCLSVCPTYELTRIETFSPRGRLSLLRAVEDGRLELTRGVAEHLYHCLDCRSCDTVCPPGVGIGELIVRGRAAAEARHARPWWLRRLLDVFLASPARVETAAAPLRLLQALRLDRLVVLTLGGLPGIGATIRTLQAFAPRLSRPLRRELPRVVRASGEERHRVAFFLGCLMNVAMPDVSRATLHVLARAGCTVLIPREQACCGAPHDDQGQRATALRLARRNIALFESLPDGIEAIVTDCAGCGAALKEYALWLADDPEWASRARRFSARVRDVTEWLDAIWPEELKLDHEPRLAVYHDPCHLANIQGVRAAPRSLLARVSGLELRPLANGFPVECCGSAGIYNLTHTARSLALLERKMAAIEAAGAEMVVSANPGCLMQIAWGARRANRSLSLRHVVEILDASLPKTAGHDDDHVIGMSTKARKRGDSKNEF